MELVEWEARYSVGNERLDQQHKRIVDMINRLGEAIDSGTERTTLMKILSDLAGYIKIHFSEEELIMEQHGFPYLAEHREQHGKLNRQFTEYFRNYFISSRPQTEEVMAFLKIWLYDHILEQDKRYAPFLEEQ